jgi:hypothetical protein
MEIKYIQLYDCLGYGADTQFGKIMEEREFTDNHLWIPTVGNLIRMDSGKYNGLYEVVAVIYNKPTKLVRIKMEKYNKFGTI